MLNVAFTVSFTFFKNIIIVLRTIHVLFYLTKHLYYYIIKNVRSNTLLIMLLSNLLRDM